MQKFPYEEQINAKQDRLRFDLSQLAKIADVDAVLQPVIQAPKPFRYACTYAAACSQVLRLLEENSG